jgi:biopolymer transport protein ExbD
MALGSLNNQSNSAPIAEINMVPLVDVMLVLLVIFIITAPLLTNAVKIDLPKASSSSVLTAANHIELAIQQDGRMLWNGEAVAVDALPQRLAAAAAMQPQPELHIHADRLAYYEPIAKVMSQAGKAGLTRIAFVTDPGVVD